VLATFCVKTRVRQNQPFDRLAANDMALDDFVHVSGRNPAVPNCLGINNQVWAVFTLVQAACFVGPHPGEQSPCLQFLFKQFLQCVFAGGIATAAWIARRPLVAADENVSFEFGHDDNLQDGVTRRENEGILLGVHTPGFFPLAQKERGDRTVSTGQRAWQMTG
jgi:hypothetical protein